MCGDEYKKCYTFYVRLLRWEGFAAGDELIVSSTAARESSAVCRGAVRRPSTLFRVYCCTRRVGKQLPVRIVRQHDVETGLMSMRL